MIVVASKRKKMETLMKEFPGAKIIDVTSHATDEFVRLSPFYFHGGIPIPDSDEWFGGSVEGIWQGLKVFEHEDVSIPTMRIKDMKNMKRTKKVHGEILGHRRGVTGDLMDYLTARLELYIPIYNWVLENRCQAEVAKIREMSEAGTVVLLDFETNGDPMDTTKPLSHASLIKAWIEGLNS